MRGWEMALLVTVGILGTIALSFLIYLGYEWYVTYYHDFLTFGQAIGSIGGVMSGLAGSLFAFAGSILFFVALMVQLREHRQSIVELEKTTSNHRQALRIARQEKEFNICLQATKDVVNEFYQFKLHGMVGKDGITELTKDWLSRLQDDVLFIGSRRGYRHFIEGSYTDDIFPGFRKLYGLNLRVYWIYRSIHEKKIAKDDMAYLNTLIMPIILELCAAQDNQILSIIGRLNELAQLPIERQSAMAISKEVVVRYRDDFQIFYDVRSSKEMKMP